MNLHELTMSEFTTARKKTISAILPVGALEQHGPHLPLGLDALHAFSLARETSRLKECFVAPPINYGLCRSTGLHPGTIGVSSNTLSGLIYDIGVGLFQQEIRCLCILTGHAGGTHQATILNAGENLLRDTKLEIAVVCVLDLLGEARNIIECEGDSHAGEVETSLALYLWPELVKGSALEEYPTYPKFILVRDKVGHWPGGVWGDPGKASAEKGRQILEIEARALARILEELESAPQPP